MIHPPERTIHLNRLPKPNSTSENVSREPRSGYGRPFLLAYAANALVLVAIALLYRFADFISLLGGTEFHLGWIVGVGIAGSIFTRLTIGAWIDRYGSRPLWIGSLLLFAGTCVAHLLLQSYSGPAIYLLRIGFCCAVAGVNGASMTFVSNRGSEKRIAEMVGMLGTAGFLGALLGTQLGDLLFATAEAIGRPQIVEMFLVAAGLAVLAIPLAWAATRGEKRTTSRQASIQSMGSSGGRQAQPNLLAIFRRHNPGVVLAVGVALGIGTGLPATFLRPFAAELNIPRIGLFFTVYSLAAIITRVITRRWVERYGHQRIILLGLGGLAASIVLLLTVGKEWQLIIPALGYGFSHAILFPSVVAAGSLAFPAGNRGMATLLMLATWDVGQLVGAPLAGATLRIARITELPPYPTMFLITAGALAVVWLWYAASVLRAKHAAQSPSAVEIPASEILPTPHIPGLIGGIEGKESVDFSVKSGSNIIMGATRPVVGQEIPAPSSAGGGEN
ncbi:MAG: MFS transporter [Pirellulales bacterium]|nr:MFS transporter [Pirellulales bacterium]